MGGKRGYAATHSQSIEKHFVGLPDTQVLCLHHRYSPADVREIESEARAAGATGLICTEKDRFNFPSSSAAMDLWVCAISLRVEREQDFWRTMMAAIESRQSSSVR